MTAFQTAQRKAKYGHRDWLLWQIDDGSWETGRAGLETVRVVARSVHMGRKAFLVHANCGTLSKVFPRFARIMLSNAKAGYLYQN